MKIRTDIQSLRGLAVLIVVVYHAKLGFLQAGYLGVDMFFVISGFLITSMVKNQIENGSFSFVQFYFRRAKRLLPAAYVTFLVTTLLAALLLTSQEMRHFADQLFGAITFTGNIVLWRQGSYFGGDADLKPLLHTWSLAIEEQYYIVLPAALFLIPRKYWTRSLVVIFLFSLALCCVVGFWKPDAAFYLFPTRAWELAIGSIGALAVLGQFSRRFLFFSFWPAVGAILVLPIFPIGGVHPGFDAFIVCCSTLIIILRKNHALFSQFLNMSLAKIGDFSYSLYLVHWPLFALASNIWIDDVPYVIRISVLLLSLLLGYLQYRFVENPVRQASFLVNWKSVGASIVTSVGLVFLPFGVLHAQSGGIDYAFIRRGNTGLDPSCAFQIDFSPKPNCQSSDKPSMLIWGDSYAMHLLPGIDATRGSQSIIQATKYVCGPLLSLAPIGNFIGSTQNRPWAESCLSFNDSVIEYLKRTPTVDVVVLSSVFKQYMTPKDFHSLQRTSGGDTEIDGGVQPALFAMQATVKAIRALGKRVVVVAPPPALDWDAGRCLERKSRRLLSLGKYSSCEIPLQSYREKRANVLEFLKKLPEQANVEVISFDSTLINGGKFEPISDGTFLYIANGHFSYEGSKLLAAKMLLVELISKAAK